MKPLLNGLDNLCTLDEWLIKLSFLISQYVKHPHGEVQKDGNWSDFCNRGTWWVIRAGKSCQRKQQWNDILKCMLTFRRSPGHLQKVTALVFFTCDIAWMKGRNRPTCHKCVKLRSFFSLRSHVMFKANSLVPLRREAVKYDQCPSRPWRPSLNHVVLGMCSPRFPHVSLAVMVDASLCGQSDVQGDSSSLLFQRWPFSWTERLPTSITDAIDGLGRMLANINRKLHQRPWLCDLLNVLMKL